MITAIDCRCGNQDPQKAKYYEGSLGYEALICTECGRYYDHMGAHACNEWSIEYLSPNAKQRKVYDVLMDYTQVELRYLGGNEEPIVSIKWSEDRRHEDVISELAEKICNKLK